MRFSDVPIGGQFWRADLPHGPESMTKTSATRYEWSRGFGTAEAHYSVAPVARVPGAGARPIPATSRAARRRGVSMSDDEVYLRRVRDPNPLFEDLARQAAGA